MSEINVSTAVSILTIKIRINMEITPKLIAKTSARLARLSEEKVPYISVLTDPTTGGTTASYAMLGDFNIAEPKALIGFAGPRVIKQTIGRDLPAGFQRSEFLLEKGFVDIVSRRQNLKHTISTLLDLVY